MRWSLTPVLIAAMLGLLACSAPPALTTPEPLPTYTIPPPAAPLPTYTPYPTFTALPSATPRPTYTPHPTHTPRPTYTPAPTPAPLATYTPYPTATPRPTYKPHPTATAWPTHTPYPTPTEMPTPTPTPTAWTSTGYWYRDTDFESGLNAVLKGMDVSGQSYIATLDAIPSALVSDVNFSLGCISDFKVAYLSPYSYQVPPSVDGYTVGMWNGRTGAWVSDETHRYRHPVITDDGVAVYVTNQAQVRQIIESMRSAIRTATPGLVLSMGMYDSTDEEDRGLWGEFDPTGLQDVLQYLPCFR